MKKLKKINNALLLSIVLVMLLACCMPFFATKIVLAEDEDAPRVYYLSDSIPTLSEDELVSMFGAVVTKEIFPDYDSGQFNEFLNSSFNLIAQNNDIVIIEIKRIMPDFMLIKDLCDFFTSMGCKVILLSTYDLSYFQFIHEGLNIDKYIKCPTVGLYDYVANSLRDMITNHNFGNGSIILIDSRLVPFSYFDY